MWPGTQKIDTEPSMHFLHIMPSKGSIVSIIFVIFTLLFEIIIGVAYAIMRFSDLTLLTFQLITNVKKKYNKQKYLGS